MPESTITLNKAQLVILQDTLKKEGIHWSIPKCETHDFSYSTVWKSITVGIVSIHIEKLNQALRAAQLPIVEIQNGE